VDGHIERRAAERSAPHAQAVQETERHSCADGSIITDTEK
jgi:hypothetical protein